MIDTVWRKLSRPTGPNEETSVDHSNLQFGLTDQNKSVGDVEMTAVFV